MSHALQEGAIFANRYRVLQCIAQGGMGAVYEVIHLETERRRALKVMHAHTLQSEDLRERFKREAKVAAHVESDFIVDVFDAGVDEATGMPFLVMELLRGEELGKRLKRLGRLPPSEVVTYLHQTALALDKTHRASIIHRDLKPENLFLTDREDGPPRVKVLDFGIAKLIAEGVTNGAATQSIGTPLYMSPEQLNPASKLSGASDVYSLGMVAYTLLVGAPYWAEEGRGGNIFAIAVVAIQGPKEPASVRAARNGVALPPAFDAWFARVTSPDPTQRFAPATAAVRELGQALGVAPSSGNLAFSTSGHSIEAPSVSAVTPSPALPSPQGTVLVTPALVGSTPAVPASSSPGALPAAAVAPAAPFPGGTILVGNVPTQVLGPSSGPEATGTTSTLTGSVPVPTAKRGRGPLAGLALGLLLLVSVVGVFLVLGARSSKTAVEAGEQAKPTSSAAFPAASVPTSSPVPDTTNTSVASASVAVPPVPPSSSSSAKPSATPRRTGGDVPTPALTKKGGAPPPSPTPFPPAYTRD